MSKKSEKDLVPGDIFETDNGNRYVVLPNGMQAYLGNKVLQRSQGLTRARPEASCRVLGHVNLPAYDRTETFTVRMYDQFDGWIDIQSNVPKEVAEATWNKHTHNGTRNTKYADGHYYEVFPSHTQMLVTPESLGR